MSNKKEKSVGYILPQTHWDREWRYPLWKNRMLLVEMMEELLQVLDAQPGYRCFLFDGQVAPIEDYLEVMPQQREKVTKYIREGRIAVGPWYTLPDLYPLDGECLARNLLKGIRVSLKYGGCLKVGYNSFGWGQTAQLPQLYIEFGMDFIICAKRVSEKRAPESEFMWQGPDGTRVLTSRLGNFARSGFHVYGVLRAKYGMNGVSPDFKYAPDKGVAMHNADAACVDEDFFMIEGVKTFKPEWLAEGVEDAWQATEDTVLKSHRLFLNGTDFTTAHPEMTGMIRTLNASSKERMFVSARLEEYAKKLHELVDKKKLRVIKGELRDGPSAECSGNALASRAYLKQLNKKVQNVLIHKTEPLCSSLFLLGKEYPKGFLDTAWTYALESHPHDSINGVTQDKTADDVEHRLKQALELGQVVLDKAAAETLKLIDLSGYDSQDLLLVVFNPLARPVREIIRACVATPQSESVWSFSAIDGDGNTVAVQEVSREEKAYPVHDLQARPWPFHADRHLCFLDPGEIPAGGYKVIRIVPESRFKRERFYWPEMRRSSGEDLSPADNVLENERLRVEVASNGTLTVKEKASGRSFSGLHYFEDAGDVGNYWAYYPPYANRIYTTLTGKVQTWTEENGPLSATLAIEYTLELPESGKEPMHGVSGTSARSEATVAFKIISRVTLKKGAKKVDIKTRLHNNVRHHRLRVAFPTGIPADFTAASGHFTVDSRPRAPQKDADGKYWPEMQTLPMQHFVDVSDGKRGLALLNNGLTEYELRDDERATLYLTLFRAMGNMIVTWWEAVGMFADQQGSQVLRDMEFEYSIYPHSGDWEQGGVYAEAEKLNRPPSVYQVTPHKLGRLPQQHSFWSVEPANLIVSAFKKAEDRESCILRVFNPTGKTVKGTIRFAEGVKKAWLTDMNETRRKAIAVKKPGIVKVSVGQNKIVTLEVSG
ncbi:MAG: glycosyl hydrolase-related protein [Kiritimatiellaeota bacterium]|nr:glycosyl hydrolase-related protein [Kiritimatiellota bacterium]